MANGNQGSDFNKFLSTLFSASLANERLKVQKDSLALQEISTMSQSEYRDYLIENSKADARRQDFELEAIALAPYPELQKDWLKNQPFIKKNPEYGAKIDATFKARTELDDRITAAAAMPPGLRLEEYRKIRLDTNLSQKQRDYLDLRMDKAREESTVTLGELKMQPAYNYYLQAQANFKAISDAGRKTDPKTLTEFIETEDEFQKRRQDALDRMFYFEDMAREQERTGRGAYPGPSIPFYEKFPINEPLYDNIEDISDAEVDETLSALGAPAIESNVLPPEFTPEGDITPSGEETIKPKKITSLKEAFAAGTPPKEEMALTGNVAHRVNEIYKNYRAIEKIQNVISDARSRRKERGLKGVGKNEEYNQKEIDKLKNKLRKLLSGVYDPSKKGLSDKFMEQYKQYGFVVPTDKRESMMKYLSELF